MRVIITFLLALSGCVTSQRDPWCGSIKESFPTVEANDFLLEIFHLYGNNITCKMPYFEFDELMHELGVGHADDHYSVDKKSVNNHPQQRNHDPKENCFHWDEIVNIYNVTDPEGISQTEFEDMASALIQQSLQGCHYEESGMAPAGEVWGYGLLSITLVSSTALLGLILVKWQHTAAYKYVLIVMLGMAMGTLTADAIMHLIPHGILPHDHAHGSDDDGKFETTFKTFCTCLMIWFFFNLQLAIQYFGSGRNKETVDITQESAVSESGFSSENEKPPLELVTIGSDAELVPDVRVAEESLGYMVAMGDAFHNFADGLTIAAAYTDSWQTGLATTIAIFCHEVPHEFGDVAAQFQVGWKLKRVFWVQVISQMFAYFGFIIGVPISQSSEDASSWILLLAAGMFLYVALCDIIPELMESFKEYDSVSVALAANGGIAVGYSILLVIGIAESIYH